MKAQVAPLEGNKVKLSIEVEETEVDQAIDETFEKFAKDLRVPGFRPGKGSPPGARSEDRPTGGTPRGARPEHPCLVRPSREQQGRRRHQATRR